MGKFSSRVSIAAAIVSLGLVSLGQAVFNEDGDWQFWNQDAVTYKITDSLTVCSDAMFRLGDDASELWYQHYDVGVNFKVKKRLTVKPSFRLKKIKRAGKWEEISNPSLNVILSHKVGGVKLKNNCRFSYWNYDTEFNMKDRWFYRNILMVESSRSLTSIELKPFIKEDFFFDCEEEKINRNRLSTGLLIGKPKILSPTLYLMWQAYKPMNDWVDNYIVGVDVKIPF